MTNYIDSTFADGASDEPHCEIETVRVRLLGMTIDLGDDETPDVLVAFYEAEGGGIIVHDVEQTEEHLRSRLTWFNSLDEVRRDGVYSSCLERLEIV